MDNKNYRIIIILFRDNERHALFEFYYSVYRSESNRAFHDL